MITFEEAYKIAKTYKPIIDGCDEFRECYVFGYSGDDDYIGGHEPIVVFKKNGEARDLSYAVAKMKMGRFIREREV